MSSIREQVGDFQVDFQVVSETVGAENQFIGKVLDDGRCRRVLFSIDVIDVDHRLGEPLRYGVVQQPATYI